MSQVAADKSEPMIHLGDTGLQLLPGVGWISLAEDRAGDRGDFGVDLVQPMKIGRHSEREVQNEHADHGGGEDARGVEGAEIAADASAEDEFALAKIDQIERLGR